MKKILAIALCLIMVGAIAVSAVSAYDPDKLIDSRELQEYGQAHFYLGDPATGAAIPNSEDATVSEGEYVESFEYKKDDRLAYWADFTAPFGNYLDNEWFKMYYSYDEENIYFAYETKDKNWVPNKDGVVWALSFEDNGTTVSAISRLMWEFFPGAEPGDKVVNGVRINPRVAVKNQDGSWASGVTNNYEDYVNKVSGGYNEETQILTVEVAIDIDNLKTFWQNELDLEEARLYVMNFSYCRGESVEGAGDEGLQGIMWFYLSGDSRLPSEVRMRFTVDYPEISYWGGPMYFPNIVHFCEKPAETTPPPTSATTTTATQKITMPPVPATTTAAPTDAPTDAPKADATTAAKEKGCGSTVALSALAILPMLGAAVVFGKKKED